jgi:hypothetical protein
MRITCPHCQQSVTVPDAAAGQPTPCPRCGDIFTPPALAGAALDLPPAPPPPASPMTPASAYPPASKPVAAASTAQSPSPSSAPTSGTQPCCRCVLRRDVVQWLAPAGLFVTLILTFFPWQAAAPGGYTIFTQSAWGVIGGSFSESIIGNDFVEKRAALLNKHGRFNVFMLLYLLGLLLTAALALGDKFMPKTVVLPDVVRPIWAQRQRLVSGLCAALFLLLVLQCLLGFGLESAAVRAADEAVPPPTGPDGAPPSAKQIQTRDLNHALEVNSYGIRRTWWFHLAALAQLIAVVGVGLMQWLDTRGVKAEPWAEFYC